MISRMRNIVTRLVVALAVVAGAGLAAAPAHAADKIHLKDGRVLEGRVVREEQGFVWFAVKVGGIEQTQMFKPADITKLERDAAPAAPAAGDPAKPGDPKADASQPRTGSGAPKAVILTLEGMVGMQMAAKSLLDAIPELEKELGKDGNGVVVLKINSGGGFLLEIQRLSDIIHNEYKPRFRTVAWIESAISAAAMTAHCVEEIYFMPEGNYGACTGWSGALTAIKDRDLEQVLYMMEKISARGNYDTDIMRAMQIMTPLSCTIDENGDVEWYGDNAGQNLVNPKDRILTFNSHDAEKFRFSKGTAANIRELTALLGYEELDWVGVKKPGIDWPVSKAEEMQLKWRADTSEAEARFDEFFATYGLSIASARATANMQDRGGFVAKARRSLDHIRQIVRKHPNFGLLRGLTPEWFEEQEEMLRDIMK